jgi:hypothetical protein
MDRRTNNRLTQDQINDLIEKYSSNESVLDLFYTGPVNTPIRLECALRDGVSLNSLAYGIYDPISLPEYKNGSLPSKTVTDYKIHMNIVKNILQNFINNNPNYFRKISITKYAVTDEFIMDVLLQNKDKKFDVLDITSIFRFMVNPDIFDKIVEMFYLPYKKDETLETIRREYLHKQKPYKFSKRLSSLPIKSVGGTENNNA